MAEARVWVLLFIGWIGTGVGMLVGMVLSPLVTCPSLPPSFPPFPSPPPPPLSLSLAVRYNEFHDLNEKLKKRFPDGNPKLPGKRILGNNFDPDFIKQRREGLHDFICKMMKVIN